MNIAKTGSDSITIQWRIEQWYPDLGKNLLAKLKKYHEELLKHNRSVSLIGVKTIPVADAVHFSDSILACRIIRDAFPTMKTLHDFGSGNGFPGVIFAAMHPDVNVVMVEADAKHANFLRELVVALDIKNAEVITQAVARLPEGSVEYAVSRDFAPLAKAILTTRKVFKMKGVYMHMKGEEWVNEIANIPTQLCSIWTPSLVGEYTLPVGEGKHAIVKTEKIAD